MAEITWLASYPKSGNTWIRYLLSSYVFDEPPQWRSCNRLVPSHGFVDPGESADDRLASLSVWQEDLRRAIPGPATPTVLKTHYVWSDAHALAEHTARVLHVTRHPLDVAKSAFNHRAWQSPNKAPKEHRYLTDFLRHGGDPQWKSVGYGTWEEHEQSWMRVNAPSLLVSYEALCHNPIPVFSRVVEFLGLGMDAARVARTVQRCGFENLKTLEREQKQQGKMADRSEDRYFFNRGRPSTDEPGADRPSLVRRFEKRFGDTLQQLRQRTAITSSAAG